MRTFCFRLGFLFLLIGPLLASAQQRPAGPVRRLALPRVEAARREAARRLAARKPQPLAPAFTQYLHSRWVDSLMRVLTPDQRAAQLFMVAAYSNRKRIDEDSVSALIQQYGIGGLIFFQGGPGRQAQLLNRYQSQSRVPLLVAMDAEWGVGMRLDSVLKFPFQSSIGGLRDTMLIYDMGREVARQFRRLGMHVNFAPVVDVSNNPLNPVTGYRSWSDDPATVARLGGLYMRGMQDAGILAVAKHFPGHGDVDVDSHLALPTLRADRGRLDSIELPPFRRLIRGGIGGMMVAHLNIPALDTAGVPSTLARPIVTGLLRDELKFNGLIFTDAMNMGGVISKFPPGEADVRALLAGNDILEFSKNVPLALRMVRAAVDSGRISQQEIDQHCRRVLALKQWAGLNKYQPISSQNLVADLNPPHAQYLNHRLTELSLTVLRNDKKLLPLRQLDSLRIATLIIGGTPADTVEFQRAVADYAPAAHFHLPAAPSLDDMVDLRAKLFGYNTILVGFQDLSRKPATNFGITPEANALLRELVKPGQQVVVTVFGSAYAVPKLRDINQAGAVILAYQESANAQQLAAQLIFGGIGASGKLPLALSEKMPAGFGLKTEGGLRLRYANPEDVGLDNRLEARVDSLVGRALATQATPGAQVLIARRGTVVLRKSYGNQTYAGFAANEELGRRNEELNKRKAKSTTANSSFLLPNSSFSAPRPVRNTDVYDLASLTKVLAATPALMQLQAAGKFSPDSTLGQYFPTLRKTNKASLKLRDVLAHQAGLKAFIPFWQDLTNKKGELRHRYVHTDSSARFPLPVAAGLWGSRRLPEIIVAKIGESALNEKPGYVYSDLSFYLYPQLVKARTGLTFEEYVQRNIYRPLGASTLGFRPKNLFAPGRIVPTEYDSTFRRQLLNGTVDDEGAALLGGISGHAGLFGTANDVAKLAQTYAWNGRYGGRQLFAENVLAEYTRCQFCPQNRRGLGFDRQATPPVGNTAKGASGRSFGHAGFTGTYFWVDPATELVVVVLTNRVHPSRHNNKLSQLNLRTDIQQVAVESIK
ncbi:glycoside hydrolase family 3 N-terminal domain-containing protein [Hymenobacter sp. ASUV-10]|uniref:beta-N-acetylhexosaminidase n=1 Tax=Hymenobacter aranciens TaxID=3063996 RepID=A0ABT9BHK0_9BACT|nr:glycoside hydrolase family 3 N-terminal domain-containing protein [Hymenobacter sp. ASUV-10]MDO7877179.1 glycoside hydrolase family 3 N-terminal domain-containing protein [Hymenobacter sp. ASUV-10]